MSKQIKELMAQVGTDSSGKWMGVEHAEKLVELTVQKCIDVIEAAPTQHCAYTTHDQGTVDCAIGKIIAALNSHFELKIIYKA